MIICTFLFGTHFALFQSTTLVGTSIYERQFKKAEVIFDLPNKLVHLTEDGKKLLLTMDCKDGSKD